MKFANDLTWFEGEWALLAKLLEFSVRLWLGAVLELRWGVLDAATRSMLGGFVDIGLLAYQLTPNAVRPTTSRTATSTRATTTADIGCA